MVSRLMLNLHELANVGQYSTTGFQLTNTDIEYQTRTTGVELDTLRSGDLIAGSLVFPNPLGTSQRSPCGRQGRAQDEGW